MTFKPTPEQQARIDEARAAFEEAQREGREPSEYFIEKCSSEAGIEPPVVKRN